MQRLFISYRSLNSDRVDSIVSRLRSLTTLDGNKRFEVWQDKDGIPGGQDWWEAIVDAIIACDVFLFMISSESVKSINCRAEVSYARIRNRPILPFVLDGEFAYNPVTGKNDIAFWHDLPEELNDIRAQFIFDEGTASITRITVACESFAREPQRWRNLDAPRPKDPRPISEANNTGITLYDEACDYAGRLQFAMAQKLFQRLINDNDSDFADDSHQWIMLLRAYQRLVQFDERQSTRHKVAAEWAQYQQLFPKPFIDGIFDPKGFQVRVDGASAAPTPTTTAILKPQRPLSLDLLRQGLPSFDWIAIPGKGYSIGKYPVTNAQFKLFIDANGYANQQWWTEAGWHRRVSKKWIQPRYWTDKQWNGIEHPVVGISWYEAVAYASWLSEVTGEHIILPTEDQWQYAAQGGDGRRYPWGNDWDCQRCNNSVSPCKSDRTTPVRQYEGGGDSPFGVVDMAGNVWEWCLTDYDTYTNDIYSAADKRVLRGGSCGSLNADRFSCDYRDWNLPHGRSIGGGFRLALSS